MANAKVWACGICNGTNVGNDGWIDANTGEVLATYDNAHCFDCDKDTTLIQRDAYPETFTWVITMESKYHELNDDYDVVRSEEFTGSGAGLEEAVVEFCRSTVIGVDDDRFDGNGAPLSTIIRIELVEAPEPTTEETEGEL